MSFASQNRALCECKVFAWHVSAMCLKPYFPSACFQKCRPMAKCTRFSQVCSNRPTYANAAASSCDAHVLGSERGVTFWRPQAPIGYATLGDCITAGSTQPTFQVGFAFATTTNYAVCSSSEDSVTSWRYCYMALPHNLCLISVVIE